jgi:iron only hydrogenase large subunit-like protein
VENLFDHARIEPVRGFEGIKYMELPVQAVGSVPAKAIYAEDEAYSVRKSHENPAILELYEEFLKDGPCGPLSHKLLHTCYTARGKYIF